MPFTPREPAAAAADLNAALDAFEADLFAAEPVVQTQPLEQQRYSAFFHS